MAGELRLKVPESEYQATLQSLDGHIRELEGTDIPYLVQQKRDLLTMYQGAAATEAAAAVDAKIEEVRTALQELKNRRNALNQYLTDVQQQDSAAKAKFTQSLQEAKVSFK